MGIDPFLHTIEAAEKLQRQLTATGRYMVPLPANPVDAVWDAEGGRPAAPQVWRSCLVVDEIFPPCRGQAGCWVGAGIWDISYAVRAPGAIFDSVPACLLALQCCASQALQRRNE